MGMRACCLAKATTCHASRGTLYDLTNSYALASAFPSFLCLSQESSRRASAWREESFQPKDLGWLDSCDEHRNEGEMVSSENHPLPTVALLRPHGLSWQEPAAMER
ncbi:hypothetical protein EXN51_04540 [Agrobacterium fabrum]|nr:hypothetical protein EXN51_04540 [Agrobacterium fabrum]